MSLLFQACKSLPFISLVFLLGCNTGNTNKDGINITCDSALYKTYSTSPCGFGFCYLKTWETQPPVYGGWSAKVVEPLKDSSDKYAENFTVLSNFTQNGYTIAMGTFKNYIDSSRRQIQLIMRELSFTTDKDTTWNGFDAHAFEYRGRLFYDTLHITQLAINANTYNQQFVLTFVQNANAQENYDKIKRDLFSSFKLPNKKCGER